MRQPLSSRLIGGGVVVPLVATSLMLPVGIDQESSATEAAEATDVPPAVDPGTPEYTGLDDPVPDEPVPFDPTTNMLRSIYDADQADGGDSYWIDRVLGRPAGGSGGNALYTKGDALYMYTHQPATLGFAGDGTGANQGGGGFAYREAIAAGVTNLYTVTISDAALTEDTAERQQSPSHWASVHTTTGLRVEQRKFITQNNVAVTLLDITNTGDAATTRTLTAATPGAVTQSTSSDGTERLGSFNTRYNLTTVSTRFSGEGFTASGNNLARNVTLDPGESVTAKLQLGAIANEIPESEPEYERYRDLDPETALQTQLAEYNQWWVDNVPYIDVPDENVKKMSYYRTFLNRFNYFDANIPGNDFQFPVSVEGALGYDNAIQLTQPMHMQDLKWFRDPTMSYGNWVSSGETSKCDAFIDNPGSHSWGNTYEQYIAREAWNAYQVHGGDSDVVRNFAHYAECDVDGQLAKYDSNDNFLVEYNVGFLTGNDADTPTFHWANFQGQPTRQDRAEAAFQWSGAKAAAEAYAVLGNDGKADEMEAFAGNIQDAILTELWDDSPAGDPPVLQPAPATRSPGQAGFGNAVRLNGPEPNQNVEMPEGIVSELTDATFAGWVNWNGGQDWSRFFDFGTGTTENMFLTPNAGGAPGMRFAITTSGGGAEQQVTSTQPLPTGWQHVAVTLEGDTGTLWLNGQQVASNTNVTLDPADLGDTDQNWLGRSQYGDPLLNGAVDEFQVFDRALTQAEIASLLDSPAGTTGGGNVARYSFEEPEDVVDLSLVIDSSGNGQDATVVTRPDFVGGFPGQVFKHQLTSNDEPVQWKDHQNFAPFIEGVVPTDDPKYREALRFYADAEEYPIMPFYTANQRDKAMATAVGIPGSNNFSNINSTLQAQVFSQGIREYPSEHITEGSYRALLDWSTWVQYVGGDNRMPNNNEFFFNWNPETQTFGRSGIHHNILGAYNFMLIDDMAGVRPRLDDVVELWPIDVAYGHFAVNNLSYHGRDLTVVWNGDGHYENAPEGFSLYVDGERMLTVDQLAHVTWDPSSGEVSVLDDGGADVAFSSDGTLEAATDIGLFGDDRAVDMFQKAGRDLSLETGWLDNVAEGKPVSASFTTTTPALRATSPEFAVDGWTISGLPASGPGGQAQPGYLAPNTIWGACSTALPACGNGSSDAEEWLEIDLEEPQQLDTVKLYFFSDKSYNPQQNSSSNTYRQPSSYTIQYHDGSGWVDVPDQVKTPDTPQANYNQVTFPEISAQRVRVQMTRTGDFGIGVKEVQLFDGPDCDRTITGTHSGPLRVTSGITCLADGATVAGPVTVQAGAGLVATGASINGQVTSTGATIVHLIDSEVGGRVTVSGSAERVAIANTSVIGQVRVVNNSTGDVPIVVAGNDITGPLTCSGNEPPPVNGGVTNGVTGPKSGQCATL